MSFPKINLHIHSTYSDGKNSIAQIVKRALSLKLNYIAITDHLTNSWKAWVSTLKNNEIIFNYLKEISDSQFYIVKNNLKLVVLKGIEVDLASSEQFIKKTILINKFDLILFEYLQSYESIAFVENLINYWQIQQNDPIRFPILGLAHFDPSYFMLGNLDILMTFLKKHNIYFEFNSSYPAFYSTKYERFFEKLREFKIPVGIGCDSHNLNTLDNFEEPLEMINYYNLEKNLGILIDLLDSKDTNKN
ncbi:MAG: PHP domain-containing protein [Candidatus Odinarchaeota archaeon]